jgi:hypothetical protein
VKANCDCSTSTKHAPDLCGYSYRMDNSQIVGPGKQEDFEKPIQDMFGAWSFADIAAVREDRAIAYRVFLNSAKEIKTPGVCCSVLTRHRITYLRLFHRPQGKFECLTVCLDDRGCCLFHQLNVRDAWEVAEENWSNLEIGVIGRSQHPACAPLTEPQTEPPLIWSSPTLRYESSTTCLY